MTTTGPGGDGSDDRARDEPDLAVPGTRSLGSDVSAEDAREFDDDELLEEFGGSDEVSIDADPVGLDDPVEVEDVMLGSWSDDDDALGTESGGFGPDRPRDARMPGLYSSGEIDDVRADGDVHDDDLVGQGQDGD